MASIKSHARGVSGVQDEQIVVFCKDNLSIQLCLTYLTALVIYHQPFQQN